MPVCQSNDKEKGEYKSYIHRKVLFIIFCLVGVFLAVGVSVTIGARDIGLMEAYSIIWDHITGVSLEPGSVEWLDDYVVWNNRIPRALFAVLVGAALAVAGATMQSVMNNPLADAYTTGISSGAMFGVSMSIIFGFNLIQASVMSDLATMVNAFIFSMLPVAVMVSLSAKLRRNPATMILAGVAISYLFNSFNTLAMVIADPEDMNYVTKMMVGAIDSIAWEDFPLPLIICVPCTIIITHLSNKLNILSSGDSTAKSLGLNTDNLRVLCLVLVTLMVAITVCFCGIIGFVGLVSPHIVRTFIGNDNRYLIPASALFSGFFLLFADIVSRLIASNGSVPVGVVMSFIGAPIFLYLVIRRNSNVW